MPNAKISVPKPVNEPVLSYAPGTSEREEILVTLKKLSSQEIEIPLIIGGEEVRTGKTMQAVMPHNHEHVLAKIHLATEKEVDLAIESAGKAWQEWSTMPWEDRVAILKKAAILLSGTWRQTLNAAAMLNMSKNVFQAEIDAACELIDFFNFNTWYAQELYAEQPMVSPKGMWNTVEHRPLEGFVLAVTPFNFVSIAGNLPTSPVLMGNTALWKPASSAVYPAYFLMKLFQEAGIPDGVINFIPGPGSKVGPVALNSPQLAGIHFTGSTATFQSMWNTIGSNIDQYNAYPRIVGETGGKDFTIAHESADVDALVTAAIRAAFEYQGQKCSALSRLYVPDTFWQEFKTKLVDEIKTIKMGDPADLSNFMNAVIDRAAFNSISNYIDYARDSKEAEIISGGKYDDSEGFFIEPTVIVTTDPHFKTMEEEIFGPVLTIYVYDPKQWTETLHLVNSTSPYGLTGAVFARERSAVVEARRVLTHAAGNFYINDKPTAPW